MVEQEGISGAAVTVTPEEVESRLATALVERGVLTRDQIEEVEHRVQWLDEAVDRLIVREGLAPEEQILQVVSEISGIPFVPIAQVKIEDEALKLVPPRVVAHYRIMPIRFYGGTMTLACDRIQEIGREDQLRIVLGCSLRWVLCRSHEISEYIKHYYGVGIAAFVGLAGGERKAGAPAAEGDPTAPEGKDISGFVRAIVHDAVASGATDVHFEPYEDRFRLRYRIDGVLSEIPMPQGVEEFQRPIVSSIKVMAQLNIAEKRLPQDGRFGFDVGGQEMDVRVSVLPSHHGEAINLRILNRQSSFLGMEELGLQSEQHRDLEQLATQPYGIVVFTGPTGSGKTTSLYASLASINTPECKIITVEDPVEYQIEGITQLHVRPEIDFTFASGLRAILRHDPDVVLIGEIRDEETARIATSASLTGHLVFSTLHTNDSASAATRLIDMGIEPYLVSSSLQGVIAQQLIRRVCQTCREPVAVDDTLLEQIRWEYPRTPTDPTFFRGQRCPDCRFTGYRGRRGIFEVLVVDDDLRALIVRRASSTVMMQRAVERGLMTLRQSGWGCVIAGGTTVREVLRVTPTPERHRAQRRDDASVPSHK